MNGRTDPDRPLTEAELRILALIADGETAARIGRELGITPIMVTKRMVRIRGLLGARNAAHAVHIAHLRELLGKKRAS